MSPGARAVLRLGAYQIAFTRIPPHAAVGESVGLAAPRERGFVNAILRRLADDPPPPPTGETDEDVSARTGLAPWAVKELRVLLGDDAELAAEALGERGWLSLRTNTCRTSVSALSEALRAAGLDPRPAPLHPDCLLLDGGDPSRLPGFTDGWFAVQDQASAFVVSALDPQPGDRVFDACAAPGGKAGHVACLVGASGCVVASDVHPERASLVRRTAQRLGVRVLTLAQDATAPALREWLRPCARGRPVLGDRIGPEAPGVALASAAGRALPAREAPGPHRGCGGGRPAPGRPPRLLRMHVPRAETDAVCDALVRHRPELQPASIDGPDGAAPRLRLWPHRHGSDGMFVAAFTKRQ